MLLKAFIKKYNNLMEDALARTDMSIRRASVHYVWSVLVLGIYGGQVCPYIEGLGLLHWLLVLSVVFALGMLERQWGLGKFLQVVSYKKMANMQFLVELAVFMDVFIVLLLFNYFFYDFPFVSGMKIFVGVLTMGFFAAVDLSLERERIISRQFTLSGESIEPSPGRMSLTVKFMLVSFMSITLITGVTFLVITKDLDWLIYIAHGDILKAKMAVLGELAFITAVVLVGIFNLILSYTRNLKVFFDNENILLRSASEGDLSGRVTVSTNDEFGVMAWYTNRMIGDLGASIDELKKTQDATIVSLGSLAEIRDEETGKHILRTSLYVKVLAEQLSTHPSYKEYLTPETVALLHKSAPLHDIGKVGIPDAILLKPDRLTPDEFEVMKRHPRLGAEALRKAERVLGGSSFLSLASEIALSHHEKWDGSGYPVGLRGQDIPMPGRIMALADVYDALTRRRVYKPAVSHKETRGIILEERGWHFDPDVVDAFLAVEGTFISIAMEHREIGDPDGYSIN